MVYKERLDIAKTTNIYVRLEPGLKEQAESVLEQPGIPVSNAVNIFLKQVVIQRGIPFEVKLPAKRPLRVAGLTESELNVEEEGILSSTVRRLPPLTGDELPSTEAFSGKVVKNEYMLTSQIP